MLLSVIPAEAGIQSFSGLLDSRLRGSDDLEHFYEFINEGLRESGFGKRKQNLCAGGGHPAG